jgi:CheY-like chemotaxis protein
MEKLDSILLVDDDKITNYINERIIRKSGICKEIKVLQNGAAAISYLQNNIRRNKMRVRLIFLDINMPVMDGFGFLEKFQELKFPGKDKVVVIMLTTSTHLLDMGKLFNSGNTDFLTKPLSLEKLMNVYRKYFGNEEASEQIIKMA